MSEPSVEADEMGTCHTGVICLMCHTSRNSFKMCKHSKICFCSDFLSGRLGEPVAVGVLAWATSSSK